MSTIQGYLVVLAQRGTQFGPGRNPRYRGIYQIPMWPSTVEPENPLLEKYVFEITDTDGYIHDLAAARRLLHDLRAASPRSFELIYCTQIAPDAPEPPIRYALLGYDIIPVGGDYLTHVGCFPDDPRVSHYLQQLNDNGLFDAAAQAFAYLADYVRYQLPEWDCRVAVFRVELVPEEA